MNKLYEKLQKIKQRPALFLGEKSLARLDSFILGYIQCMNDFNEDGSKLFNGFEEFVQEKYNIRSHNSSQIISFYSFSKEEAFDKFYNIFEEFIKLHPENLD